MPACGMRPTISTFLRFLPVVIVSPAISVTAAILEVAGIRRQHRQRRAPKALIGMEFREAIENDALGPARSCRLRRPSLGA